MAIKFIKLAQKAPFRILELNEAAEALGVKKRRIYDVTNILEGIGLIRKTSKNHMGWNDEIGNINNLMLFKGDDEPPRSELGFFDDPEVNKFLNEINMS